MTGEQAAIAVLVATNVVTLLANIRLRNTNDRLRVAVAKMRRGVTP